MARTIMFRYVIFMISIYFIYFIYPFISSFITIQHDRDKDITCFQAYSTSLKKLKSLAENGNVSAQLKLGFTCQSGLGVQEDHEQALYWFHKAADQGNAVAQASIGAIYYYGNGVSQDYDLAVVWYRKAAEQGFGIAESKLAEMYSNGQGVPLDYVQAYAWFSIAALNGDSNALQNRDTILKNMTPSQIVDELGSSRAVAVFC